MKTEITLNEKEIEEAIGIYLVQHKGMTVLKVSLSAIQAYDDTDTACGWAYIKCVAEVKSD